MHDEPTRHPYFGVPPPREPQPAGEVPSLQGKRVVLSTPEGFIYDMRAISPIHPDAEGREVIDIVSEEEYFRWMFRQAIPKRESYPVELVWIE